MSQITRDQLLNIKLGMAAFTLLANHAKMNTLLTSDTCEIESHGAQVAATSRQSPLVKLLFVVALCHGLVYASFLPPWGLIDEGQHLHYIQHIAEQQALPIMGQTHLSTAIVDSLFATDHWTIFHWPTPSIAKPSEMGLVGDSYEAYQPPLFYALMAPIFALLPGDILSRLFVMRGAMVLLSLVTLGALYRTATLLWGKARLLPLWAVALLLVIPERTMAVTRVNNDVLVEVLAALFIWQLTHALRHGVTPQRGLILGLLLGLGLWTKFSMAFLVVPLTALLIVQRKRVRQQGVCACRLRQHRVIGCAAGVE